MAWFDRSAKWLIEHHAASLLWLGGERRQIRSCRAAQAEVVLPAKLPDGLLEVELAGGTVPELHLAEVFVYPDQRAIDQVARDLEMVHADRREVPDITVLTLRPSDRYRIPDHATFTSRSGNTSIQLKWRTRELWHIPAADLLARNDPGLIPWVPLCRTSRTPKSLLTECRRRIEQTAPPDEQEALLVTTCIYADLRFDDVHALKILIGDRAVLAETPLVQEFMREGEIKATVNNLLSVIETRFGSVPEDLRADVESIAELDELTRLLRFSVTCENRKAFEKEVRSVK